MNGGSRLIGGVTEKVTGVEKLRNGEHSFLKIVAYAKDEKCAVCGKGGQVYGCDWVLGDRCIGMGLYCWIHLFLVMSKMFGEIGIGD